MPADLVAVIRAVAGGDAVIAVILAYGSGLTRPGNSPEKQFRGVGKLGSR